MKKSYIVKGIAGVLVIVGIAGAAVMYLWNWLMPYLFKLPTVDYWQSLGLLVLSTLLFKSGGGWRGSFCKDNMKQKWAQMTPDEREQFRSKWETRCKKWSGDTEC